MATNFDDFKLAVETISGGKNTVILDDIGMPSVMVPFPALTYADIMSGGTTDILPGFLIENVEKKMFISKFLNVVVNNRAYSLPTKDPRVNITFDAAIAACRAKGGNWGLNTLGLWAAVMSWCQKNGTVPRGNTTYGAAGGYLHEKGIPSSYGGTPPKVYHTATGSGPATWYHDHTTTGIADLVGNVSEWLAGMRLVNGEIQILPNSDALKPTADLGPDSTEWKAILQDGSLVAPGTALTLKYDGESADGGLRLNTAIEYPSIEPYSSKTFTSFTAKANVTVPQLLYGLGLMPITGNTYTGTVWVKNQETERFPRRGGSFYSSGAGLGAMALISLRTVSNLDTGFRSVFYE